MHNPFCQSTAGWEPPCAGHRSYLVIVYNFCQCGLSEGGEHKLGRVKAQYNNGCFCTAICSPQISPTNHITCMCMVVPHTRTMQPPTCLSSNTVSYIRCIPRGLVKYNNNVLYLSSKTLLSVQHCFSNYIHECHIGENCSTQINLTYTKRLHSTLCTRGNSRTQCCTAISRPTYRELFRYCAFQWISNEMVPNEMVPATST